MANDTVTSRPRCFSVQRQPKMGKDTLLRWHLQQGGNLINHHKIYLSVQCIILCNCLFFSSYNISVPNDSCCIISFRCWSGFGMLLSGKTQKKHLGDLPPTVPDLKPPPIQKKWRKRPSVNLYFNNLKKHLHIQHAKIPIIRCPQSDVTMDCYLSIKRQLRTVQPL